MRIESLGIPALAAVAIALAPPAFADPTPGPDPVPGPEPTPVAHLSSPDRLPPGTTTAPTAPEGSGLSYLRDLWHAVQTQEVSGADALLLLTQRPMNANAAPPPGLPAGPQQPPAPAPEPAPTD